MRIWTRRILLGAVVLVFTVAPVNVEVSPENMRVDLACADGLTGGCRPMQGWVCFGERDYVDKCPLDHDDCTGDAVVEEETAN